ncbi:MULTISPECIES: DUF547 domain-containing protein [Flavobacteriaceae]|uniref:DUF547 domain-containing protein n=1 Tax=Flavobacteriaceae TaxID=49546 RepID=UPI001491AD36|nr:MULTISPECIES: DUF547 domain-containing protein [Allomuricauda]MDC6364885.1 DUF547 domain-containing protein [Muricauda sp. AC10]
MYLKKIILVTLVVLLGVNAFAQNTSEFFSKTDDLFREYVKEGRVDYAAIKSFPKNLLELIDLANGLTIPKQDAMRYQAFWINVYNLLVIKGIVDNYPVKSPLDVPGFFDKVKYAVGGHNITLNAIENELLRKNFPDESRFHFVLVCAGLGCPPIINGAYLPNTLESQLQRQTELSLNNPDFVRIKGKKVGLSQIFEWYKKDFIHEGKSLVEYVNQYRTNKIDTGLKVFHYPYDWSLNEIK